MGERGSTGLTPLIWAARYWRKGVVKLLPEQKNAQPEIPGTGDGRTAVSLAAKSAHEGVARVFLSRPSMDSINIGRRSGKCCSPYSRYLLCSDSFRESLRICAEDLGIWLWLGAFGSYVQETIANAGMRDSFGMVRLSGRPGEKQKYYKISRKELEARRWESVCFLFS